MAVPLKDALVISEEEYRRLLDVANRNIEEYVLLRDKIDELFSEFVHDDDVAEPAIYCEALEDLHKAWHGSMGERVELALYYMNQLGLYPEKSALTVNWNLVFSILDGSADYDLLRKREQ